MNPFLFSFFVAASCVSFAQDLTSSVCSSSSSANNVIIEDIHPSKQSFSFDHESKNISATNSVRTLKINETQGKLETVTYFLSTTARESYDYNPQTNPYQLKYGPLENNTLPFEVNFKQDPTIYVRTSGVLKNQNTVCGSSIQDLDCVNPSYTFLNTTQQQQNPQTVEELTTYFNKPKPSRQKKGNVLKAVSYFYDSTNKQWKSYTQDVFNLPNKEKGIIGENVLDCLMLKFGWKRLNGIDKTESKKTEI